MEWYKKGVRVKKEEGVKFSPHFLYEDDWVIKIKNRQNLGHKVQNIP